MWMPLLFLLWPAAATAGVVLLAVTVGSARDRQWLRVLGLLLATAALASLTQLLSSVLLAVGAATDGGTDSIPLPPCRVPDRVVSEGTGYRIDVLPVVRFTCVQPDGSTFGTDEIPAVLTPLTAGLALLSAGTLYASRGRIRVGSGSAPDVPERPGRKTSQRQGT
ncbi:hypothetical protein [Kitasatospora sp. NPDC057198]|uniref:hypothetical protein n=1 Tax=Kitasatospora sp. NPDC057198 TaxID=3346046 RepID=UPI003629FE0A